MNIHGQISRLLLPSLAIVIGLPLTVLANDYPARKPGLWEISYSVTSPRPVNQTMKQCIDAATDQQMFTNALDSMGKMGIQCSKNEMKKSGGAFVHEADCTFNGSKIHTSGSFKGDFSSNYTGESESTYNPPMMGLATTKTTFNAKYLGECQQGQKPGDMILPNGMTMNIANMGKLNTMGKIPGMTTR